MLNIVPKVTFPVFFTSSLVISLASCGGSGNSATDAPPSIYGKSSTVVAQCATPRTGIDPATNTTFADKQGSLLTERQWLRAWIDEDYLWNSEVPAIKADDAVYANTPATAFFDLLKTPLKTANGNAKDRFHFYTNSSDFYAYYESGTDVGYGLHLYDDPAGQRYFVSYVDSDSPAALAGIVRGTSFFSVDGIAYGTSAFNAPFYPNTQGETHTFNTYNPVKNRYEDITLSARAVKLSPVQNVKTFTATDGSKTGYFQFNAHIDTAEKGLFDAITSLKNTGVKSLVIDMRYNGGGYLSIASQLAYMIAGKQATQNKIFEELKGNPSWTARHNDRLRYFLDTTTFGGTTSAKTLPTLNLKEVTILSTSKTCSASEAVINSLRGIDVKVNVMGSTTCGKPYGFYSTDNCGVTYSAINFQGVNQKGQGDYAEGFTPTCASPEDFNYQLGDSNEELLNTALNYINTGKCLASATIASNKAKSQQQPTARNGTGDIVALEPVSKAYQNIAILDK